jgi:hypothetical protein
MVSEVEGKGMHYHVLDDRILQSCQLIWNLVAPVLCDDSPEGFDQLNDPAAQHEAGTKELLSFCWRALKEARYATLFLRAIDLLLMNWFYVACYSVELSSPL